MKLILETLFGILIIAAAFAGITWFLFREQFHRATKYIRTWWEQDSAREERERKLREKLENERADEELRAAAARERAEAEVAQMEEQS
ncbi:MAG TPA: hypothetical protein VK171_10510 [Fimbriimonas sp.]|nr:hypothetical protein [Fimbriimonas sp.]